MFADASRLQSCVPSFTDTFGSWADEHAELRSLHLLTNTSVIPVSFLLDRTSKGFFQDDVFVDTFERIVLAGQPIEAVL